MPSEGSLKLCAVGDVMLGDSSHFLGRGVGTHLRRHGIDYPLAEVADRLRAADLFIANLESPLSGSAGSDAWSRVYRGDSGSAAALRLARCNVATIANNHVLEHGPGLLAETRDALASAGILTAGFSACGSREGATVRWEQNGLSLSLYADSLIREFSGRPCDPAASEEWLLDSLGADDADIRIVSLHWGDEYVTVPSSEQRRLGHRLVEAGATLVLGHHPHVLQPVERVGRSLIAYSLGNFLFDQDWSELTRGGGILEIDLDGDGVRDRRFVPTVTDHLCRPRPAHGEEARLLNGVVGASPGCGDAEYRERLARGLRRHRLAMKWELLRHLPRVSRDTIRFLLTKKKRPRPGWRDPA